jgi:DNA invertase Pin-like site-specific DNA recombinase
MPTVRAAIYARISEDPLSREEGVRRQVADCRELVKARGWTLVGEPLVDNDVSAFSGKRRDEYEALLDLVRSGALDRVVVYMTSRLWRSRRERAEGIDLFAAKGVSLACVRGTDLDLSSSMGGLIADVMGGFDTMESAIKSERVRDAAAHRARDGRPNGTLPFGWHRERVIDGRGRVLSSVDVEDPAEAAVVREIVDRLLAGDSQKTIVTDLNARGLPSPLGKAWRTSSVRKIALRESNVARRVHQGKVIGDAAWPAIVDLDKHAQVVALLTDPSRRTSRDGQRRHLLTYGIGSCGRQVGKDRCGSPLRVATKAGHELYICDSSAHVGRRQARVDELVEAVIVARLQQPDAIDLVSGDDTAAKAARERAAGLRARLESVADEYADGAITTEQLRRITARLRPQIDEADAEARRASGPRRGLLEELLGPEVEQRWAALSVTRKRAVMEALGVTVHILPTRQGAGFDPESVVIAWATA